MKRVVILFSGRLACFGGSDQKTSDEVERQNRTSKDLPAYHSSHFAPTVHDTLKTGSRTYCVAALAYEKKRNPIGREVEKCSVGPNHPISLTVEVSERFCELDFLFRILTKCDPRTGINSAFGTKHYRYKFRPPISLSAYHVHPLLGPDVRWAEEGHISVYWQDCHGRTSPQGARRVDVCSLTRIMISTSRIDGLFETLVIKARHSMQNFVFFESFGKRLEISNEFRQGRRRSRQVNYGRKIGTYHSQDKRLGRSISIFTGSILGLSCCT
ncbi:hypothetical protein KCU87_g544, partial [Aureobasidium melanogenum]